MLHIFKAHKRTICASGSNYSRRMHLVEIPDTALYINDNSENIRFGIKVKNYLFSTNLHKGTNIGCGNWQKRMLYQLYLYKNNKVELEKIYKEIINTFWQSTFEVIYPSSLNRKFDKVQIRLDSKPFDFEKNKLYNIDDVMNNFLESKDNESIDFILNNIYKGYVHDVILPLGNYNNYLQNNLSFILCMENRYKILSNCLKNKNINIDFLNSILLHNEHYDSKIFNPLSSFSLKDDILIIINDIILFKVTSDELSSLLLNKIKIIFNKYLNYILNDTKFLDLLFLNINDCLNIIKYSDLNDLNRHAKDLFFFILDKIKENNTEAMSNFINQYKNNKFAEFVKNNLTNSCHE